MRNLQVIHERLHEFREPPLIVIVWACPEPCREWPLWALLSEGLVHEVVGRPPLPGEFSGQATSYPESHNIRTGLTFAQNKCGNNAYAVVMAADITPKEGTFAFVDKHFHGEIEFPARAVLFFWENGISRECWHTNFFAVSLDEAYWPPVSPQGHLDTLEVQWGRLIQQRQLPDILRWHNSGQKRFAERHLSEELPTYPRFHKWQEASLPLFIQGYLPLHKRVWQLLTKPFRKR